MSFILQPGVVGFTNLVNQTVPNDVVPVSYFLAQFGVNANIDVAFQPKGTGAILGQIPDSTIANGNKRGPKAVDFQLSRTAANQIAQASNSFIGAGTSNKNQSASGGIVAGDFNFVNGTDNFIGAGSGNTASNARAAVVTGANCIASAVDSMVLFGSQSVADATMSMAFGGNAITRGISGCWARQPNLISTAGDNQTVEYNLQRQTTIAAAFDLTTDGNAVSASNHPILPDTSAFKFKVDVLGFQSSSGDFYSKVFEGVITRGAGAATTVIQFGAAGTVLGNSAGAAAWTVTIAADVVRGGLAVTVQSNAVVSVKWGGTIVTKEMTI